MKAHLKLISLILLATTEAFGWGQVGHKTTAYIAEAYLTPQTKKQVAELLDGERLIHVANWADNLRGNPEYAHTMPYHYQNMPAKDFALKTDNVYLQSLSRSVSRERRAYTPGVIEAIAAAEKTLSDPKASHTEKQVALKFLVHFVGDLHQPMHTGKAENVGGNLISLEWRGRQSNLHKVWDTEIIQDRLSNLRDGSRRDPSAVLAQSIMNTHAKEAASREASQDITEWYKESLSFQPFAYNSNFKSDQDEYESKAASAIETRLLLAGKRLGLLLNQLLGKQQVPTQSEQMIEAAENVIGPLTRMISFQPKSNRRMVSQD